MPLSPHRVPMRSGEGRAHRVGERAINLYVSASVASDSTFPWCDAASGAETCVDVVLPGEAVLISRGEELTRAERQQIQEILTNDTTTD